MNIRRISLGGYPVAVVRFAALDSYSRTYENLLYYAQRNRCKEFTFDKEDSHGRFKILLLAHQAFPDVEYIAIGQKLPSYSWSESAERFSVAHFLPPGEILIDDEVVDMTLSEPC